MGEEIVDPVRSQAHTVRQERLRQKLHRELGLVVLEALADEKTIEVMVNPDEVAAWLEGTIKAATSPAPLASRASIPCAATRIVAMPIC